MWLDVGWVNVESKVSCKSMGVYLRYTSIEAVSTKWRRSTIRLVMS